MRERRAADFDWQADDSVVVQEQQATAVYVNDAGQIVIRQHDYPEDDHFVVIAASSVCAVIAALQKAQAQLGRGAA